MVSVKEYIYDLIKDRRNDPLSQAGKLCLLVLSYMYGFLVRCHHFFYKINQLKSYKSQIAVVSVGNITLGGTGKTPFAMMLAERLKKNEINTAILIRGYGEDEWKMLEDRLGVQDIKIFVGRDRIQSAKKAESQGINALILDDGFQHCPLKRDLDIVLLDSTNPFGNGRLFPRGILREPIDSLKRADIIILTKTDKGEDNVSRIETELQRISPGKKVIKSLHRPNKLYDLSGKNKMDPTSIKGKNIYLLSAICDASYFRYTVEKIGGIIRLEFVFPDHYTYKKQDLERIFKECKKKNIDTIITTEKDIVKLKKLNLAKNTAEMLVLGIEIEITEGVEELDALLHDRLRLRHPR